MMNYDDEQRYARQVALPDIGVKGQKALASSKVLVVGAGGLGCPALLYLASAGVGTIGVIDNDRVDLSNLSRQILFETSDVNASKAESAKDALFDLNPHCEVVAYNQRLTASNAGELIAEYDVVVDGSDNFETRYIVADICALLEVALISGAVMGYQGQLSTFTPYLGEGHPCYRCWHPEPNEGALDKTCSESGVLGSVAGVVGSWQATEVLKTLLNIGSSLSGYVMLIDGLDANIRKVNLNPDPTCRCQM